MIRDAIENARFVGAVLLDVACWILIAASMAIEDVLS